MVRHLLFIDRKNATSRGWYICFELGGKQQKVIVRNATAAASDPTRKRQEGILIRLEALFRV